MNKISICVSVLLAGLVGCGGIDDSEKLSDLSVEDAKEVCLELVDDYPERTVTCGNITITIGLKASECNDTDPTPATCTATVGDARDCTDGLYSQTDAQLCDPETPAPAACARLSGC